MMHKAWSSIEEVPYCFSRSSVKFQGHTALKIIDFDPNWAFPDCNSKFEITDGHQMMHKAWSSIEEVPYCFSRSCVKLQGHMAKKSSILTQIGRYRTATPVWIHRWLWNVAQSLKQQRRGALLFSKVIHQISRSHGTKHHRFRPKLGVSGLWAGRSFQIPQICLVFLELTHWSLGDLDVILKIQILFLFYLYIVSDLLMMNAIRL